MPVVAVFIFLIIINQDKYNKDYEDLFNASAFISFKHMRANIIPEFCNEKDNPVDEGFMIMFNKVNKELNTISINILHENELEYQDVITSIPMADIKKTEVIEFYKRMWNINSDEDFCRLINTEESNEDIIESFISFEKNFPSVYKYLVDK